MTTPQRTRTTLTHADFYKLCEWMKTASLEGLDTQAKAAQAASATLGFSVSESSIRNAMATTDTQLPEATLKTPKRDRTVIIARELVQLMKSLGHEPTPELVAVSQGTSIK